MKIPPDAALKAEVDNECRGRPKVSEVKTTLLLTFT